MERQKDKTQDQQSKEVEKETQSELEALRKELQRLRELKKQKEVKERESVQKRETEDEIEKEDENIESKVEEKSGLDTIEERLNEIDKFLVQSFEQIDNSSYEDNAEYVESQLQTLEQEIVGEKGVIEKKLSPYEKLLENYPWLEETKHEFMYFIPDKKKNPNDYKSWRTEWAKVVFDYAKCAILHILYLRQLHSEKPFKNFDDRNKAINEIAEELVEQNLAKFLNKQKDQLRVYWKTLEIWAEDIYNWALEFGKLDPILIFEIREADREFSNLPKLDLEEVFRILSKDNRGFIIKTDDDQITFKIKLE